MYERIINGMAIATLFGIGFIVTALPMIFDEPEEELVKLNYHKPDIYFSRHPGSTVWAIKQGYAALFVADEYMIFGYEGTLNFAKSILDTIKNRSFEKSLAARIKLPYTKWWYEQDTDKFLKPEGAR